MILRYKYNTDLILLLLDILFAWEGDGLVFGDAEDIIRECVKLAL